MPKSAEDLPGMLAAVAADSALLLTGSKEPPADGLELAGPVEIVSTSELVGIVDHRRDDLTVTVRAGERVTDLLARLAAERQWIPLEGPAERLSVGGLIASAPPGALDRTFGPLRRQLLAVRTVTREGIPQRWGRAVMKNVAGYDMPRLYCGSFGQLGVITEASFRLWPLPVAAVSYVTPFRSVAGIVLRAGAGRRLSAAT